MVRQQPLLPVTAFPVPVQSAAPMSAVMRSCQVSPSVTAEPILVAQVSMLTVVVRSLTTLPASRTVLCKIAAQAVVAACICIIPNQNASIVLSKIIQPPLAVAYLIISKALSPIVSFAVMTASMAVALLSKTACSQTAPYQITMPHGTVVVFMLANHIVHIIPVSATVSSVLTLPQFMAAACMAHPDRWS